jgi:hypothetical protein
MHEAEQENTQRSCPLHRVLYVKNSLQHHTNPVDHAIDSYRNDLTIGMHMGNLGASQMKAKDALEFHAG